MSDLLKGIPRIVEGDTPPVDGPYITVEKASDLETVDTTDAHLEQIAKGYILGTQNWRKGRDVKEKLEERVVKKIGTKGKLLTDKLFELIEGVYIEESYKNGRRRIYKVPPKLEAIKFAIEIVIGKPTQKTEHTEEKRGILTVEHIIKGLATKGYGGAVKGTATDKKAG